MIPKQLAVRVPLAFEELHPVTRRFFFVSPFVSLHSCLCTGALSDFCFISPHVLVPVTSPRAT